MTRVAELVAQSGANLIHGLAFPEAPEILHRGERTAIHAIDIQMSVQMIDFMLQDTRVPARGLDSPGLPALIEAFHAHPPRSGHQSKETRQAQAAFKKFHRL